ncbi:MAG: hypothetical protein JWO82_584 [Akkermansiaceae bacterium]|nr:hypothetical protein [Akkermansiaceae bacterium]
MPNPDPSLLARVLSGERVFDLDTDTRILQASNEMSARLLFELFQRADLSSSEGAAKFAEGLQKYSGGDPVALIGFNDGRWQGREAGADAESSPPGEPASSSPDYYLRLEFVSSEACFYQSPLFPSFKEPFVGEYSRRSQAQFQYVRLAVSRPEDLQRFIANLRENPFLLHIHESSEQEFRHSA